MRLFTLPRWTQCLQIFRVVAMAISVMLASFKLLAQAQGTERPMEHPTFYRTIQTDGLSIFYREAGPKDAPTLLLLHGLPSSSRMFEPLSPGFPIVITWSRRITPASATVAGRNRKNSRIRLITMRRS
jgi:hypothetical protein